jgi:hypothetical protein
MAAEARQELVVHLRQWVLKLGCSAINHIHLGSSDEQLEGPWKRAHPPCLSAAPAEAALRELRVRDDEKDHEEVRSSLFAGARRNQRTHTSCSMVLPGLEGEGSLHGC